MQQSTIPGIAFLKKDPISCRFYVRTGDVGGTGATGPTGPTGPTGEAATYEATLATMRFEEPSTTVPDTPGNTGVFTILYLVQTAVVNAIGRVPGLVTYSHAPANSILNTPDPNSQVFDLAVGGSKTLEEFLPAREILGSELGFSYSTFDVTPSEGGTPVPVEAYNGGIYPRYINMPNFVVEQALNTIIDCLDTTHSGQVSLKLVAGIDVVLQVVNETGNDIFVRYRYLKNFNSSSAYTEGQVLANMIADVLEGTEGVYNVYDVITQNNGAGIDPVATPFPQLFGIVGIYLDSIEVNFETAAICNDGSFPSTVSVLDATSSSITIDTGIIGGAQGGITTLSATVDATLYDSDDLQVVTNMPGGNLHVVIPGPFIPGEHDVSIFLNGRLYDLSPVTILI